MAFRRARQRHITAELLHVVSGFEAIMSKPTATELGTHRHRGLP